MIHMQTALDHNKMWDSKCTSQLLPEAHKAKDAVRFCCLFWNKNEADYTEWNFPATVLRLYSSIHCCGGIGKHHVWYVSGLYLKCRNILVMDVNFSNEVLLRETKNKLQALFLTMTAEPFIHKLNFTSKSWEMRHLCLSYMFFFI